MLEQYAVGLTWISSSSKKEFYRDNFSQLGLYHAIAKQAAVSSKQSDLSKISVAAVLSEHFENLLLITDKLGLTSSEGLPQYWVCIIERGCVVNTGTLLSHHEATEALLAEGRITQTSTLDIDISGDKIFYHDDLIKTLPYLEYKIKNATKPYTICIDVDDERITHSHRFDEITGVKQFDLLGLLKNQHKSWHKYSINVIRKPKIVPWLIGFAFVVFIGWFIHSYYQNYKASIAKGQDQDLKMQTVQERLKLQNRLFMQNLYMSNAGQVLDYFYRTITQLPSYQRGWQLSGVQFDVEKKKNLVLSYQRMTYSTMDALIEVKKDSHAKQLDIAKDTNSAVLTMNFDYQPAAQADKFSLTDFQNANNRFEALTHLISSLQENHLEYVLDKTVVNNIGGNMQPITISGMGVISLKQLIHSTANNHYLVIQTMSVVFESGLINQWQFKGMIYE